MTLVTGVGVGRVWVAAPIVALDDVEPVLDVVEGLAADVVDVGTAVAGVSAAFNEAGGAQDAKVLADEWLAAPEGVGEAGGRAGLVRERPHDPLAHRLGEQVQRGQGGRLRPPVTAGLHVAVVMHRCLWLTRIAYSYAAHRVRLRQGGPRVCHTTGPFWTFLGCQGATRHPTRPADSFAAGVPQGPRNRPSLDAGSE
jgi:hypothetical protein